MIDIKDESELLERVMEFAKSADACEIGIGVSIRDGFHVAKMSVVYEGGVKLEFSLEAGDGK